MKQISLRNAFAKARPPSPNKPLSAGARSRTGRADPPAKKKARLVAAVPAAPTATPAAPDPADDEIEPDTIEARAAAIRPNFPRICDVDEWLGNGGTLQTHASDERYGTPEERPDLWVVTNTVTFDDFCLPNGASKKRTVTRWKFKKKDGCKIDRIVEEYDDMEGQYFPKVAARGYVPLKDRVNKGRYRVYAPAHGSKARIPTNRTAVHHLPKSGGHASTSFDCPVCTIVNTDVEINQANLSLFGVPKTICGGCQAKIVPKEDHQAHKKCDECGRGNASCPEHKDGSGRTNFLHAGCFRQRHGIDPPQQKRTQC